MIVLSIKVEDELNKRLQRRLKASGKTRSAFIRELIERELRAVDGAEDRLLEHPMARFKGIIKGVRRSRNDAFRVDEILLSEGYGADGADR